MRFVSKIEGGATKVGSIDEKGLEAELQASIEGEVRFDSGARVVVGTSESAALGGHLIEAYVRPTLELMVKESSKHVHRVFNRPAVPALIRV